ncbi:uncharacterized protein FPRO_02356 [Fusarium proliferatum ET1]|uniref:Major facilitator superfamily (MFS) profile domain-containing protein n=1 Tax=Fusarium proliferatum (strain ET1) TaxID=1227346 RepID=A0A1L7VAY0_FUSPR|nr:uncharacterized protein FPRO_02356 [Fusarium proliferatum ET1]CZR37384.1 uncharacterized protein FPRO_02356 [Fusarium proliferatum ET1]
MIILTVPVVSHLEHAISARHYHDNIPTSELCKAPAIQRNLSEIRGWASSFDTFSAIIVALPIGRIADHRGQQGVFMVVVAGILMSLTWTLIVPTNSVLPIKLVWASSVFLLVRGGGYAAQMLLAAMVAKACTEETRTRRLYYFYSCFIFSELVGPPVASIASDIPPWLPFSMSYFLLFLTFPLLSVMPKDYIAPFSAAIDSTEDPPGHRILRAVLHALLDQVHLLRFMLPSHNMGSAAVVFLISTLRGISLRALVQYASFRFDWKTNALIGEVALINLVLFFFTMPVLLRIVSKYLKSTPQVLNHGIVRASLSLLFLESLPQIRPL